MSTSSYQDWIAATQNIPSVLVTKKGFLSKEDIQTLRSLYHTNIEKDKEGDLKEIPTTIRTKVFNKMKTIAIQHGLEVKDDYIVVSNTRHRKGHRYHFDNCKKDMCGNIVPNHTPFRIFSMSVSLTDPSEYEGGTLHIDNHRYGGKSFRQNPGDAVLFTSHHENPHWVDPVSWGERLVLLVWMVSSKNTSQTVRGIPKCIYVWVCTGFGIAVFVACLIICIKKISLNKQNSP